MSEIQILENSLHVKSIICAYNLYVVYSQLYDCSWKENVGNP